MSRRQGMAHAILQLLRVSTWLSALDTLIHFKLIHTENMVFASSHDGILSKLGHRHDWEGIVVKWKKDPEGDWWHRAVRPYRIPNDHDPTDSSQGRHLQQTLPTRPLHLGRTQHRRRVRPPLPLYPLPPRVSI